MRIFVKIPGKIPFWLLIPTCLVFSSFTAKIAVKVINWKNGVKFEEYDILRLAKQFRPIKRKYSNLELINIHTADGTKVKVRL